MNELHDHSHRNVHVSLFPFNSLVVQSVVVFLTKDKLLDDFDGVPLNWRKKSDEFQDVVSAEDNRARAWQ